MMSGLSHLGDQLKSVLEGLDIWCRYSVLVQVVPGLNDTICKKLKNNKMPFIIHKTTPPPLSEAHQRWKESGNHKMFR